MHLVQADVRVGVQQRRDGFPAELQRQIAPLRVGHREPGIKTVPGSHGICIAPARCVTLSVARPEEHTGISALWYAPAKLARPPPCQRVSGSIGWGTRSGWSLGPDAFGATDRGIDLLKRRPREVAGHTALRRGCRGTERDAR